MLLAGTFPRLRKEVKGVRSWQGHCMLREVKIEEELNDMPFVVFSEYEPGAAAE